METIDRMRLKPALISEDVIQQSIEREFECHRCADCCKGDGVVQVGRGESDRIAEYLGMTRREFLKEYTIKSRRGTWWLTEKPNEERWCIFLEQDDDGLYGCRINGAKPDQCRSFPEKWRNGDSYRSCAGLKALMAKLRERMEERDGSEVV